MTENYFHIDELILESGAVLKQVNACYHTAGELNDDQSNAIVICHALTANSNVVDWWCGLVGTGKLIDPAKYFIICINSLGSFYGTTGPRSISPETNKPYGLDFPFFSVRDVAKLNALVLKGLGLNKIHLGLASSFGGYQLLEMQFEDLCFENTVYISTSAEESTWGRAIHSTQRIALETDPTFAENNEDSGEKGVVAARSIGMLTYRGCDAFNLSQNENDNDKLRDFRVESYMRYQGQKLANRFHAHCYYKMSECLDSHNIARNRFDSIELALASLETRTLVVGVSSDLLTPPSNQKLMAKHMPNAVYQEIESDFGHDGFLVESEKLSTLIDAFLRY